jgi:uncharacterized membrane protein YdjX (TVP38/TMEM64 family)
VGVSATPNSEPSPEADAPGVPGEGSEPSDRGAEGSDVPLSTAAPARAPLWARLLGLLALIVGMVVIGQVSGLSEWVGSPERLQAAVEAAGPWGVLLLIGAFTIGLLIQVPGIVFATAAILCYGRFWGGLLAYSGAVIAVSAVFVFVRGVGGSALDEIERPWVRRVLAQIEDHPLRTVAILRLVFWSSPQLNYALALSRVSFRHHLLGTMIGLIPIKIAVAFGIQEAIDALRAMFS